MSSFSAVLLAAGESRRMGAANKLLLRLDGELLAARTMRTLARCDPDDLVVVLGHEAGAVRAALAPAAAECGARFVENLHYRDGQMTSVNCGVRALHRAVDGIVVCPADLPLLESGDVTMLLAAFARLGRASILVPTFESRRGNPIVMAYPHREAIVAGHNLGCRHLIERHPEAVATLAMRDAHCVTDLDTPDDYAALAARFAHAGAAPAAERAA
ncbi:nucleotidyltransferase family protein [Sinimarinibacterium flocculans]|uniref:Molybdenum cofactor cytidylyltransferase n=1 Tax=Sinimarinibacterium flocculans TaxID=985250 RepID=A0A318E8T6_9GAMM|nr:nucleotidyltransferase family protein [Sinimarinibacterium flocculans]PXV65710.1 molybdenum cofactor cytidylyltransferase [Sinimarinibacterium flocculans]